MTSVDETSGSPQLGVPQIHNEQIRLRRSADNAEMVEAVVTKAPPAGDCHLFCPYT